MLKQSKVVSWTVRMLAAFFCCQSFLIPGEDRITAGDLPAPQKSVPPWQWLEELTTREAKAQTGSKVHYLRFLSSISTDERKENKAEPIQTVSRWWLLIEEK